MVSIGIYIHSGQLNFVEVSLERNALTIIDSHSQIFDSNSTEEQKQVIIIEKLKELEKKYINKNVRFCYGLPQSQVSTFSIVFPFKEKFKILNTLPFQIEDKSPFSSDKIFYDGRITKIQGQSSYVTCFVTPENNIHNFLKLAKFIERKPHLLSVEGSALVNLIQGWENSSSGSMKEISNAIYVYLGVHETTVLVFKGGHLDSISSLEWGAFFIIQKMAKKYKLSFHEAILQFFEKSFILTAKKGFTKEQVFFSELIKKELASLIHQLKLLKLSLETENDIQFADYFLMGPSSVIKNLSAYLSEEIGSPVKRFKHVPNFHEFDAYQSKNQNLLIPLGLAMEGFKRPPYDGVNLIHALNKQDHQLLPKKWRAFLPYFASLLLIFGIYSFIRKQENQNLLDQMHEVFVSYGKRIASIRESKMSVEVIRDYLKDKESLITIESLIQAEVSKDTPIDKLKLLTQTLDVKSSWKLRISQLKIENQQVSMQGQIDKEFKSIFKVRLNKVSKGKIKELKIKQEEDVSSDINKKKLGNRVKKQKSKEPDVNLENFSYEFKMRRDG